MRVSWILIPGILVGPWRRLGEALEQREIDVHVEEIRLDRCEPIGDAHEAKAERRELVQPLLQAETLKTLDTDFDPQKRSAFLVHARDEAPAVDAQDIVTVVDFLQHRVQFAAEPLVFPHAKDLGDDIGGQAEDPDFSRALEDLVNREVATKDDVATQLDLIERAAD